ncbi:glycosyltransferase [Oscillatoria salina]|uniref:glycosyltransferase n=1 Tax=Oscillatoria salina TaxID=331517 RepID=UPI0013BC0C56|nr:glycosyltransferase [Oscillatoria salina]MBZ8178493.1 glycosyl transferase [Oscillatoria salina IIICB1]NET88011.1 glycosyl transferase [Kamptonema sp. SIO1D9]
MSERIRVYVGTDRSQLLAVKVLEHSIKRHTKRDVEVYPMLDLPIPKPKDPRQGQRTGFSFSRFCIPELAGYSGKALYLDADMLVFKDIASLWDIPFDGAKVIIQEEIPRDRQQIAKHGAPPQRVKQCSVMLLDCDRLDWKIEQIIDGFDTNKYNYEKLMYELCILDDQKDIKYGVPFEWNSLEYYDKKTCLIHYTDMATQPWVSSRNKYGYLWFNEVRLMLKNGSLTMKEIEKEIKLGYFRPSLLREIKYTKFVPQIFQPFLANWHESLDKGKEYKPHKEVYKAKKKRKQAIQAYEEALQKQEKVTK